MFEFDKNIFAHLFEISKQSQDPEGVVSACLVRAGKPLLSAASADDGIKHAEYIVLEKVSHQGIKIQPDDILYVTLEPCNQRGPEKRDVVSDCVTEIIKSGIRKVVYAVSDPTQSAETQRRLREAGIDMRQVTNPTIIGKSLEIFNTTVQDQSKKK